MSSDTCAEPGCTQPAIVGWGPAPVHWLCLEHFRAQLTVVQARVRAVLEGER